MKKTIIFAEVPETEREKAINEVLEIIEEDFTNNFEEVHFMSGLLTYSDDGHVIIVSRKHWNKFKQKIEELK